MAYDKERNNRIWKDFLNQPVVDEKFIGKQMDIAAQIDTYLKESGWTQKQLAEKAGLRPSQLSKIMAGEANPTLRTLASIEEALGKDIIVCPEFYEDDMREQGWVHPGESVFLSAGSYHLETFEFNDVFSIKVDWQETTSVVEYSTAGAYCLKPTGTNG